MIILQNRACAYGKLKKDREVVRDTTQALALDGTYEKALSRRARSYGRLAAACETLEEKEKDDFLRLAMLDHASLHQLQSVRASEAEQNRRANVASALEKKMHETQGMLDEIAMKRATAASKELFRCRITDRSRFDTTELPSDSYINSFYNSFTEGIEDPGEAPGDAIEPGGAGLSREQEAQLRLQRARRLRASRRYKEMSAEYDRLCFPPQCQLASSEDDAATAGGGMRVEGGPPDLPDLSKSLVHELADPAVRGEALSEWPVENV